MHLVGDWKVATDIVREWPRRFPLAMKEALVEEAEWCRAQIQQGIADGAPAGQRFQPLSPYTLAFRRAAAASRAIASGQRQVAAKREKAAQFERGLTAARRAGMYVSRKRFGTAFSRYQKLQRAVTRIRERTSFRAIGQAAKPGAYSTKPLIQTGDLFNNIRAVIRGNEAFIGILRTAKGRNGRLLVNIARIHEFGAGPKAVRMTDKQRRWLMMMLTRTGMRAQTARGGGGVHIIRIPARPFLQPIFRAYYANHELAGARYLARLKDKLEAYQLLAK